MEPRSDPRLEAAIRAVGAWRGRDIGVTPVSVGHDERHFLVEADQELFVLRLASPSSDRPRVDATSELAVARAAASAGVAPEVIASLPQLGCLVTRFAPGRRLDASDAERDEVLASVVGSIRALHACPPPNLQRSIFQEARELRRLVLASGAAMPGSEPAAADVVRGIEDVVTAEPRTMVACHGDLTTSSLLLEGDHVWIIDYRWAGAGDPFEDLGSLAAHLDLSDTRSDALLRGYFGSATDEHRSRLGLMRTAADYLAALRALIRSRAEESAERGRVDARLARVAAVTIDAPTR